VVNDKFESIMQHTAQAMDVDMQHAFAPPGQAHTDDANTQSDSDKLQPFWSSQLDDANIHMQEFEPLGKKPANDAYVEAYLKPPAKMARTQAPRQALVGWMNVENIRKQWGDELANSITTNSLTLPRRWNHNAEAEYLIDEETLGLYYHTNPALHQKTMPKMPCVPSGRHMQIPPPPILRSSDVKEH